MNKIIKYVGIIIVTFCVVSCNSHKTQRTLCEIDSMLVKAKYDEAFKMVSEIESNISENDIPYFNLLKTIVKSKLYIHEESDSFIHKSVEFYEKNGPKDMLIKAYFYNGMVLLENDSLYKAVSYFKKVDEIAKDCNDNEIVIRNYVCLAFINLRTNNILLSTDYAHKALDFAIAVGDRHLIGNCYQTASTMHSLSKTPEPENYMQKSIDYIDDQPEQEKASYLRNIGADYLEKGKYDEAEKYMKMSLSIDSIPETYGGLAEIYISQGREEEAVDMWKNAISTTNQRLKIVYMTSYIEWLRKNGNYQEASDYAIQVINLKDSFARWQQTEAVREIQEKYDREVVARKNRALVEILVAVIVVLIVLAAAVIFYSRQKVLLTRKKLLESNALAEDYSAQIAQLKAEGKEQTKEAQELQRKLERLRTDQRDMLYKGKTLYDSLMSGGNAAQWHKADFVEFMEYYRSIDLPFVLKMEKDYRSLTPGHQTILVFQHLGYTDEQILYLMGMTDGALRTTKSRIKKKKVEETV